MERHALSIAERRHRDDEELHEAIRQAGPWVIDNVTYLPVPYAPERYPDGWATYPTLADARRVALERIVEDRDLSMRLIIGESVRIAELNKAETTLLKQMEGDQ